MTSHPDIWDSDLQALIDQGIGSGLAQSLRSHGMTLAKLKRLSRFKLTALGVDGAAAQRIKAERPPIPDATVNSLLYRSNRTCCICHDPTRTVVIHHIDPWEHSRSHDETNLVVVCLAHHDEAHTSRELSRNLTPDQLRFSKQAWEQEVKEANTRALFATKSVSLNSAFWDYFNRVRIGHVLNDLQIPRDLLPEHVANPAQESASLGRQYRYQGHPWSQEPDEYEFYAAAIRAICTRNNWWDLKRIWNVREISQLIQAGSLMVLTGNHRFRSSDEVKSGPGQNRIAYHRASKIQLEFNFDAWECTSNSSYTNLRRQWVCTSWCIARSVRQEQGVLVIAATCLAIGTGFTEYSGWKPDIAFIKEKEREEEGLDIDF